MSFQQVSTATYAVIPPTWRKIDDSHIADLKQTFTQCCHEVNRLTFKIFIATNGNFDEPINIKSLTPETPYSNFFNISKQKKFITDFQVKKRENVIRRDFIILGGIRHYGNLLLFD